MVPEPELNPPAPQPVPPPPSVPPSGGLMMPPPPPTWPVPGQVPTGDAGYSPYPPPPYPTAAYPPPPYISDGVPGYVALTPRPEPLPVEPQPYHQFYRAPAFRWWKPLVAIALFVVLYVAAAMFLVVVAGIVWYATLSGSGQPLPQGVEDFDPVVLFIGNNIVIALGLPFAFLAHRIVYRQSPRWLSSVAGGFRWRPFWRFLLIAAGGLAVSTVAQALLTGGFGEMRWNGYSLVLILTIVFTTPFQCAAEEYTMRGLLLRSVGSWFARPWLGLAAGLVVNAVVFMFLHGAGDPWLNAFYLLFATLATLLVWRTEGLEAAVALHVANNVISESLLPFQPDEWAGLFNRVAGVGDPTVLIQMGVVVAVAALMWWQGSRLGMVRTAAPVADALGGAAEDTAR